MNISPELTIVIITSVLAILPVGVMLGSALFKLFRDVTYAFNKASDGGVNVTPAELEKIRADVNVVGKAFMAFAGGIVGLWNKMF